MLDELSVVYECEEGMFLLLLDNLIRRFILSPLVLATWASSSTTYSTAITTKPIHFNVLLLALERSVDGVKSALHLRETLQLLRDQEEEEDEEGGGNDLEEETSMNTDEAVVANLSSSSSTSSNQQQLAKDNEEAKVVYLFNVRCPLLLPLFNYHKTCIFRKRRLYWRQVQRSPLLSKRVVS